MNILTKILGRLFKKDEDKYEWMMKNARNGDVLLVGADRFCTNPISRILHDGITAFTGGKWSHSGIIWIDPKQHGKKAVRVIESCETGVVNSCLWDKYIHPKDKTQSFNLKLKRIDDERYEQALAAATNTRKKKGKKYEYAAVVYLALYIIHTKQKRKGLSKPEAREIFGKNTPDLFTCSELVHASYREAGVMLCGFVEESVKYEALVTPRDLDKSDLLNDIEEDDFVV